MEALYAKLYSKYSKLKKEKELPSEKLNREQELKFINYAAAADEMIEYLKIENDKLREQLNELKIELTSSRSFSSEQHSHLQKLLMEESQKVKELSEENMKDQKLGEEGGPTRAMIKENQIERCHSNHESPAKRMPSSSALKSAKKHKTLLLTEATSPHIEHPTDRPIYGSQDGGAPLNIQQEDEIGCKQGNVIETRNLDEYEDEDEDADFNPFLKEALSGEATSSLSSEVEGLDTDVSDSGKKKSLLILNNSMKNHLEIGTDCNAIGYVEYVEHNEDIVMQAIVSSGEACGEKHSTTFEAVPGKEPLLSTQSKSRAACGEENGPESLKNGTSDAVNLGSEGAICMRTRARYSLASFTLDELETFLQETDEEDDLQNVDDEEEYKKFLAAVLQGDDSQNIHGNVVTNNEEEEDDEDNDADFELELEEALESDPDEVEERRMSSRNRGQRGPVEHKIKSSGKLNRPLRPILPVAPMGSFSASDGKHLMPNISGPYIPTVNNGFTSGFTPPQIGQLHCLIHEHVQLLIQVFCLSVLDPAKGHIAADIKELIFEFLRKYDQALAWRSHPYPRVCFFPPYSHPSVPEDQDRILALLYSSGKGQCESNQDTHSNMTSLSNERFKHISNEQQSSFQTVQCNSFQTSSSWVPNICGPILTILDVAPIRLMRNFIDDVSSAVRAYERHQIELGFDSLFGKEPLFPLPCPAETDGQGEIRTTSLDASGAHSSSASKLMPKKTKAANLAEKAKNQPVAVVPREIAKLVQRFRPLFNSTLYPHKPPSAPRVLFTDAEDELLAMGLMECNTDWKAIQQRFLPCKSKHQIFVRQKNRASSKAPENPIKAVRRMKNSPLNSEEIARIEVGLRKFKLDWISIWRFLVPYRDPSMLPRLWRIASGTQKSYKSDANKKAKRRLYEFRRKAVRHSTLQSSSEKEDNTTDNIKETNVGDDCMDTEEEAYVHEAFLEDWRPDSNLSFNYPNHQLSQDGSSHISGEIDNSGHRETQLPMLTKSPATLRPSKSQIILRPYRTRRPKSSCLVKLAPDLPTVNLPPSVRIISQSVFRNSQAGLSTNIPGTSSKTVGKVAVNGILRDADGNLTKSGVDCSGKVGKGTNNSTKVDASNQLSEHSDRCVADVRGDLDYHMHPLLFQASQNGLLPYYPPNCNTSSPSSFSCFTGKQTQLDLSLFHNPHHPRDVHFLSKSSKSAVKSSSADFHPLLQRSDDLHACSVAARSPNKQLDDAESSQHRALVTNHLYNDLVNDSASTRTIKIPTPSGTVNELDLDIHLSVTSASREAVVSRDKAQICTNRSIPVSKTAECRNEKDLSKKNSSTPDGITNKLVSNDRLLVTSRNKGGKNATENMHVESLPEIVMEQEELSDSEEEFGENVEFECEEMADSEGDNTSESEQFVSNEVDGTDTDIDGCQVLNAPDECRGNTRSMSDNPSTDPLNLNSPTFHHSDARKPYLENQVPSSAKGSEHCNDPITGFVQNRAGVKRDHLTVGSHDSPQLRTSKLACRRISDSNIAASGKGNLSSDASAENPTITNKDELG